MSDITLSFPQFIAYLLREDSCVNVPPELAAKIIQLDRDEQYVHVQLEHHEMEKWLVDFKTIKLDAPRIWNIKDWKNDHQKWVAEHKKSEESRRLYWLEQENIEVVMYRLARKLELKSFLVKELAERLVKMKDINVLNNLGVGEDIKFE